MSQKAQAATTIAAHTNQPDCSTSGTYVDTTLQMRAALEAKGALDVIRAQSWIARNPAAWSAMCARAVRMTRTEGHAIIDALAGWARVEFGAKFDKNVQAALGLMMEAEFPDEVRFRHHGKARSRGWC